MVDTETQLSTSTTSAAPILLADDDENDVFLLQHAHHKGGFPNPLVVVNDGLEACEYLEGEGPYADRKSYPLPILMLLDLKMPRLNGFEVLARLRQRPPYDRITTIVLSGSEMEADSTRARELGAHEYCVKPSGSQALVKLLRDLYSRWLVRR
jgi:CheY-like chemotaxis protein